MLNSTQEAIKVNMCVAHIHSPTSQVVNKHYSIPDAMLGTEGRLKVVPVSESQHGGEEQVNI